MVPTRLMLQVVLAVAALALVPTAAGALREPARLVVDGKPTLRVWLATTPDTRVQGVHRKRLRPGFGMWFGWPGRTSSPFWMHRVSYPLLIAWVGGNRRVLGLSRMEPCLRAAASCPVYEPPGTYRYAIELLPADRKGSGLRVGAKVRLAPG